MLNVKQMFVKALTRTRVRYTMKARKGVENMNIKGAIVTCIVVILYLALCSWRFEILNKGEVENDNTLVINAK